MTLLGVGFIARCGMTFCHIAPTTMPGTPLSILPERMTVDGFLSAHRYVLEAGGLPKYFTLYALGDLAALNSESYLRLIREPTAAQTRGVRPDFRGFLRLRLPDQLHPRRWRRRVRGRLPAHAGAGEARKASSASRCLGLTEWSPFISAR